MSVAVTHDRTATILAARVAGNRTWRHIERRLTRAAHTKPDSRNPSSQIICRRDAMLPPTDVSHWLLRLLSPLLSASVAQWSGMVQAAGASRVP